MKIASDSFTEKYNPSLFSYFYETNPDLFIIAEFGQKIIGFILGVKTEPKKAKILMLAVSEKHRKKNIATILLNRFENTIIKKNVKEINLEVKSKNKNAIKFYQKNGYKIEKRIKNYYQNSEDAFIMEKYFYF